MSDKPKCALCDEPMPEGEEMFKFHGYSGPCPKGLRELAEEKAATTTDIVKQLRGSERLIRLDCLFDGKVGCGCSHCEASDTIARLAAERDRLKAALSSIKEFPRYLGGPVLSKVDDAFQRGLIAGHETCADIARKALGDAS